MDRKGKATSSGGVSGRSTYYFRCPLCKEKLDVRESKTQKPYVVCLDCGVQLFVRGAQGISLLRDAVE